MRVIIFANGEAGNLSVLKDDIQTDDTLVAVDGGTRHLSTMGLSPHLIIGDMDSVDADLLRKFQAGGSEVLRFPPEKDETDLELAVDIIKERGYQECLIVGALGGRIDQTLANIWLLAEKQNPDFSIMFDDGCERVFLILDTLIIHGAKGDTVSLIPFGGVVEGIRTEGLEYPLKNESLFTNKTRGLSNVMEGGKAKITVRSGSLLCIHRRKTTCKKENHEI